MENTRSIPWAIAWGTERSRNGSSTMVVGRDGSHCTLTRFSFSPRSLSVEKNPAPPSLAYFPASSVIPNVVADAEPAITRIAHRGSSAAIARITALFGSSAAVVEDRFEELPGAEPHRVVGGKAGLGLGVIDRGARAVLVQRRCVERDAGDLRRAQPEGQPLVQFDELGEAGDRRVRRVTLDLGSPRLVTQDVEVRRAPVDQTQRHARVDRVEDRTLSLDPEEVAAGAALDDQPLGRAGQEV